MKYNRLTRFKQRTVEGINMTKVKKKIALILTINILIY